MPLFDAASLQAALTVGDTACPACGHLRCEGWESVSAPLGEPLVCIGTLCDPALEEPTLEEKHTPGTGYWHPHAPLAVLHFPYNRCGVWRCSRCGRGFVQYTEAGGYYVDHRIRTIDPTLITD
jgi:hypothetical protein